MEEEIAAITTLLPESSAQRERRAMKLALVVIFVVALIAGITSEKGVVDVAWRGAEEAVSEEQSSEPALKPEGRMRPAAESSSKKRMKPRKPKDQ